MFPLPRDIYLNRWFPPEHLRGVHSPRNHGWVRRESVAIYLLVIEAIYEGLSLHLNAARIVYMSSILNPTMIRGPVYVKHWKEHPKSVTLPIGGLER